MTVDRAAYWQSASDDKLTAAAINAFGDINPRLSSRTEMRFGTRGSVAVELGREKRGMHFDHETGEGGYLRIPDADFGKDIPAVPNDGKFRLRKAGSPNRDRARALWEESVSIEGTVVETYLRARDIGMFLPEDALRFHPSGGAIGKPCMVVPVRDANDAIVAIQRVPLLPDGSGRDGDKLSLGPIGEGFFRVEAEEPKVTMICEGPEDALSVWRALRDDITTPNVRVIAMCGQRWAKALEAYPDARLIADADSVPAAEAVAGPLGVKVMNPSPHTDANDMLLSDGPAALCEAVKKAPKVGVASNASEDDDNAQTATRVVVEKLKLISGADLAKVNLEDPFLIENILPLSGVAALYGPPGAAKSFWALSAALSVARGVPFMEGYVEQGNVIYCALEGGGMFSNRIAAYCRQHNVDPGKDLSHFYLQSATLNLRTEDGHGPLLADAAKEIENTTGKPVRLIVIDTLNRAFAGGNENSADDMGSFVSEVSRLREATETLPLIVHHSGKDMAAGMRGHSSLLGAVDAELKLERNDGGRLLTVSKQRDGEDGLQYGYDVEYVSLGLSPRGKHVGSLVLVPKDVDVVRASGQKTGFGKIQAAVMRAIGTLAAEPGCPRNPAGPGWPEPGRFAIVPVNDVIEHAKGLLDPPRDGGRDRRPQHLKRALGDLTAKGVVGRNSDKVWAIRDG